ncbi:MAG: hypothetical protein AAF551_10290 [Bacteroidota bacterium]
MKYVLALFVSSLIFSCGTKEVANVTTKEVSTVGEFLFEGPNTLQGPSTLQLKELANKAGTDPNKIKAIYLSGATVAFSPGIIRGSVESVLVQWVSDELPLVSVATKSPLPATGPITLEVNPNEDLLAYLKDASATLVVDVNLTGDADQLEAAVSFDLNITY